MIGIEINGEFLNLGKETIRLEKINPAFITDLFQGDYSFPFTIPDTEDNLRILGFSNIIEIVNRTTELECHVWLFGVPNFKAKVIVSAGSERSIKINISAGVKAMKIADKSLKELNWGADYTLGANIAAMMATVKASSLESDYNVYGFSFVPHKNEEFYGGNNPTFCGVVNRQDPTTGNFYSNDVGSGNKYAVVPFLFLFFILKRIFLDEGLAPSGEFWDDEEMQKILMYNNYALDSPSADDNVYVLSGSTYHYSTPTRLKLFVGPPGTFDAAGAWDNTNYEYTILQAGDITIDVVIDAYSDTRATDWFGNYMPHFNLYIDNILCGALNFPSQSYGNFSRSLTYVYTASVGDIGKKIHLENMADPVYLPLAGLIFYVKPTSYALISNTSELLNLFDKNIKYSNHVKDITVSEFLMQLKGWGIDINLDYNNFKAVLNYDKNYIKNYDYLDLTNKVTDKYEINFEDKDKGYLVNYDFGNSDKLVDSNFKKYLSSNYRGSVDTYTELPSPSHQGFIMLVANSNQLYITVPNNSGPGYMWEFFSDNYYDYKIGRGEQMAKTKLAPMFMTFGDNEGGTGQQNRCLIPVSKQPCSSQMFGMGTSDFDLRFVFYRGVNMSNGLASPQGGAYVYAGTTVWGLNGSYVGNYECRLNSKYGILDIFLFSFLRALNEADIIERDVNLSEHDILNFDVKRKALIDGIVFIVKSMSILGGETLKPSRGKFLKL